jgi:glycosyltransferase involved in cell wall biosynthesis
MTHAQNLFGTKNVLLASHHASRRGSAISLVELGKRLPQHGFEPVFVFSKPGPLADDLITAGYVVHQVKRQGLLRLGMIRHIQAIIRRHGIVLVHVNSAVAFSKYVALAARLLGVPVIWHIREPVEDKRMARQRWWVRWLANRIVVLTRPQAAFFAAPEKVSRVFNGVDLGRFRRQVDRAEAKRTLGYIPEEFLFVQVGSIEHNKGQLRAVQALATILPALPKCRLLLVGAVVEPQEAAAIKALVESDDRLRDTVQFHGETNDVRPIVWAADCLLLPSLRESFPRTIMESMAGATPVIASAVGAVEDMVEDGITGLVVAPGNIPALAESMARMANTDAANLDGMSLNSVKAAEALFSMEAHVAAIASIYSELLASHAPSCSEVQV